MRYGDIIYDIVQPCDTTKVRSDSDFGVKVSTVQFYAIQYNIKSNHWIELKLYQVIPEVLFYIEVNFQVNPCSGRTYNIGQNMLYEFCYLLPFDLCTSYLARMIFLQGCLMSCNIISKCGKDSLMFQNPFLIRIFLSILATQGKKSW